MFNMLPLVLSESAPFCMLQIYIFRIFAGLPTILTLFYLEIRHYRIATKISLKINHYHYPINFKAFNSCA